MDIEEIIARGVIHLDQITESVGALLEAGYYLVPLDRADRFSLETDPPDLVYRLYEIPFHLRHGYWAYLTDNYEGPYWYRELLEEAGLIPHNSLVQFYLNEVDYALAC